MNQPSQFRHYFYILSIKRSIQPNGYKNKKKRRFGKEAWENLNYNTAGTSIRLSFTKLTDT